MDGRPTNLSMRMELDLNRIRPEPEQPIDIEAPAALIAGTQRPSYGEIPWCDGQKTDPWDHVESAMGLAVAGFLPEARRAYEWLAARQLSDGSWHSAYLEGIAQDRTRDANMSAYVAVGVYHYFLLTGDRGFVSDLWPTVSAAIDFALSLQAPMQCAVRELWEEAGVPAELATLTRLLDARVHSLRPIRHGIHDEVILCADLSLPEGFTPVCQDGEVAEFLCMTRDAVRSALADGQFSVEAGFVVADWLARST